MSLLTNLMEHSLDDGYAEAAARSGNGRSGLPRVARARLGLALGLLLASLVVTLGAAQAHEEAPTLARERQELIERVEEGTADVEELQRRVEALRETVSRTQQELLRQDGGGPDELLGVLTGATPVQGPGIELVVDDAEDAAVTGGSGGPRQSSSFSDTGRVRDRDLQRVVNGLWQAGAEAISVNGQRLTGLSAIRAAGDAILVDNRPLAPPYTVLAVGDGERLGSAFRDTVDGQYLQVLQENYGIRASLRTKDNVRLPAAQSLITRNAEPVRTGEGSTS